MRQNSVNDNRPFRFLLAWMPLFALSLALLLAVGGCRGATDETGSFPAANKADCLPAITLIDQHGQSVSLASLKGRPVLIDFIYSTCNGPCPMLTEKMVEVQRLLGPALGPKVRMVSLTLDPEHDHPAQLLEYADEHGAEHDGWLFLTGTPAEVEQVLAVYKVVRQREADGSITHTTTAFLVGPDGHQVRIYDWLAVKPETVVADVERTEPRG